ncbi:MAG: hypothetical protein COZ06_26725 [Armatimonadetes bacterium CG_4_10_14_3_um_filter_66_18]|nr:DEAD/DEAH box helicase [Armatimonadota bacterium]OIP01887.1 MAG: hypothetical protein AUJ96_17040 [Armatimonadetes bacterium CG2_30_66_41]PIU91060.1 MAG: hypothetical protein COS65_23275 [Armatimonadetes bacterium CG06_land_8_20_14_3_00_66_21]PIX42053.1 MAG: hypothetical protein COZ57_21950 [Armatimonadetes bacterium CG_4_8_14_3_um_filter_66_20]PIY41345.1 MAG: hypothetical protein COZ06_26725 [Armatimonadetes bacterium CG_4_10_14_3_um_filter_66_18]PIZ34564.1 MAG: hypothetical protein COY42_
MPLDCANLVEELKAAPDYNGQIVHHEILPGRRAKYAELDPPLHPSLAEALGRQGIKRLYQHQVEALTLARAGRHVMVVTATASGKTLCYNAPVIEAILADRGTRALYLFPTKALAQDQLRKLNELDLFPTLKAATYDGDTPAKDRRIVKQVAQVVLTNPDMLHVGVLPNHTTWAQFLLQLRYVVVDELHTYQGVFGAHTANVLRRLRRLCAHYQVEPQFLCCSATIGNPEEAAERLLGLPVEVVKGDTAPAARKHFLFWNPPLLGAGSAGRRSANFEAVEVLARLVRRQVRTLVFTQARVTAELILRYARNLLKGTPGLPEKLMAYRAGYLPAERREIERQLFEGELLGVASTSALELGVDVGGLDAAILVGYPGRISSLWQQAGRAGRREGEAVVVLVALGGPLDQFLMRHPDYLFKRASERALLDPANIYILAAHLLCAAYELPLSAGDQEPFAPAMTALVERLTEGGLLTRRDRWFWTGEGRPQDLVNIRSASGEAYEVRDIGRDKEVIATVDSARAFDTIHEGAVYLHRGESYLVKWLDTEERVGYVERTDVNYYTWPLTSTQTEVVEPERERPLGGGSTVHFGLVNIRAQVVGYRKVQQYNERPLGSEDLELPASEFETRGFWIVLGQGALAAVEAAPADLLGSLHAAEHAIIALLPLQAACDERDLSGVSHAQHPDTGGASLFVYDDYPGGAGIAERGYELLSELLGNTLETVAACTCESGCPSCVQSPRCGDGNQPLDKQGATVLLRALLEQQPR